MKALLHRPHLLWALIFILTGILIRLINVDSPLLEGAVTRQMQTAEIAYNLYLIKN